MKFISVHELRGKSAQVWRDLAEERELVIIRNGKPIAIVSATERSTSSSPCKNCGKPARCEPPRNCRNDPSNQAAIN